MKISKSSDTSFSSHTEYFYFSLRKLLTDFCMLSFCHAFFLFFFLLSFLLSFYFLFFFFFCILSIHRDNSCSIIYFPLSSLFHFNFLLAQRLYLPLERTGWDSARTYERKRVLNFNRAYRIRAGCSMGSLRGNGRDSECWQDLQDAYGK